MKWFKHDSDALTDSKVKKLILKHGAVGYAVYFHCLELIASCVTETNINFELEHDAEIIADDLKINGNGTESGAQIVEKIMRTIIDLNLFEESNGHIFCMKLLKRLDSSQTSNKTMRNLILSAKKQVNHDEVMINHDEVMINHDNIKNNHDKVMTNHDKVMIKSESIMLEEKRGEENRLDTHTDEQTETQIFENQENLCVPESVCASEPVDQENMQEQAGFIPDQQKYYARLVFDVWDKADLPRPKTGYITFLMQDFRLALEQLKKQKLHSDEVIAACENYAKVIELGRQGKSWWNSKSTFDRFVQPSVIRRFLPDYFDIEEYRHKGKKSGSAISNSGEYENVSIEF